jgi:anti-sigma factor RsiW
MKRISQAQEDKLLDYLDGNLDAIAEKQFEDEISSNVLLKTRLEELLAVNALFQNLSLEQPSKNFTEQVMMKLDTAPASSAWSIRNGVLLLIGVLAALGAISLLLTTGIFDSTATINLNQSELPNKILREQLPSFTLSGKLMINIIILLNIVLAWIVLDRTILRPYFQRRMQA